MTASVGFSSPRLSLKARMQALRARHPSALPILFFAAGFVFDAVMLSRIDEPGMLVQQGVYLLLTGALLATIERYHLLNLEPPRRLHKVWHYLEHAIHFMMGTLLNAYCIFYFRSASGLTAAGFLCVIAGLLAANEMPRFHKLGPVVLYALYSICLTSYFAYLLPVLLGHIRPWMFYVAVALSLVPLAVLAGWVKGWTKSRRVAARHVLLPALVVQGLFVFIYSLRIAPPVPLAVKEMGIYHNVQREAGGRRLFHQRPWWKLWQKGDQDFAARPGDKVYCFARIFAPKHFHDRVVVVWEFDDPKRGWRRVHRLPLGVTQSGARGFATEAYLTNPEPGAWRVSLESEDGRTMGAMGFKVSPDTDTGERVFKEDFSASHSPGEAKAD
jgi:hypothetical protein